MKNNKEIYILYSCDAWKSTASMIPRCITTNFKQVLKGIRRMIMDKECRYTRGNEDLKRTAQFNFCKEDYFRYGIDWISQNLDDAYIGIYTDGEFDYGLM